MEDSEKQKAGFRQLLEVGMSAPRAGHHERDGAKERRVRWAAQLDKIGLVNSAKETLRSEKEILIMKFENQKGSCCFQMSERQSAVFKKP